MKHHSKILNLGNTLQTTRCHQFHCLRMCSQYQKPKPKHCIKIVLKWQQQILLKLHSNTSPMTAIVTWYLLYIIVLFIGISIHEFSSWKARLQMKFLLMKVFLARSLLCIDVDCSSKGNPLLVCSNVHCNTDKKPKTMTKTHIKLAYQSKSTSKHHYRLQPLQ